MKAILVPVDFSNTAFNAARYAIDLAKQLLINKIILYNAYQAPYTGDSSIPVIQIFNLEETKSISNDGLIHFKNRLLPFSSDIELVTVNEFAILADNIDEICNENGAGLIVMGITGGSGIDVLIGSNAVSVADHARVPVIIIPALVTFKPIENVVLILDSKSITTTTPVMPLQNIIDSFQSKLQVLNIGHSHQSAEEAGHINDVLNKLLGNYHPQYHNVENKNFWEAANEFVESNDVDMMVTIPKKHGFFDNIFKRNHTKDLAFHAHVPLMCIHEESV